MLDLSPLCAPKRTSIVRSKFKGHALGTDDDGDCRRRNELDLAAGALL